MEDASKFIAQGPPMFTNPLPNNKNMNSRTLDLGCASGGNKNPPEVTPGHSCINMVKDSKVVTYAKDYGSSQPNLGNLPHSRALCELKSLWIKLKLDLTFLRET